MKTWLTVFLAVVCCQFIVGPSAQAFLVESGYIKLSTGQYAKATKVVCDGNEKAACQEICKKDSSCQRVEPFCRNCAGTTSALLRQLFTEISKLYKVKGEIKDRTALLQYLSKEQYVLIDVKSVFNYYTPVGDEEFLQDLHSFCGSDAGNSLLAVTLDSVNQPRELKYVLCKNQRNQTTAFEVEDRHARVGGRQPLATPIILQFLK